MKSIAVHSAKSHERHCGPLRRRGSYAAYQKTHDKQIEDFLALFAHELLTPLTCIIGWTQLVHNQADPVLLQRAIEVIERNAARQRTLIDEMLGILRHQRGYTISFNARHIELWRQIDLDYDLPDNKPEKQLSLEL